MAHGQPSNAVKPFHSPDKTIGDLSADSAAKLISAAVDLALVIDKKGIVKDVTCTSAELAENVCPQWLGQPFVDIVTSESKKKAHDLLQPAGNLSQIRWRQVNHPVAGAPDLPIRYTSIQIGSTGRLLIIGQDLRQQAAQQQRILESQAAMEREYDRLRQAETRYRALFQVASEAVLIVDATSLKVVEANPSASSLLANGSKAITGRQFADLFHEDSQSMVREALSSAQTVSRVEGIVVTSAHDDRQMLLTASLVRQNRSSYYLVRLLPQSAATAPDQRSFNRNDMLRAVQQLPDGLVLVDRDRRILLANPAFLELCELAEEGQAKGEPIDRWLGRVGVDVDVLLAHVRENGSTRRFSTVVRGEYGARSEVEISAAFITGSNQPYYAMSLRRMETAPTREAIRDGQELPRTVDQLTKLVGRVPLKELVRETTDIVERLCMEAALDLTRGNRASAAEMLGLSRQSFYVKLRRHGLGELEGDEPDLD